jgi:high affinity sulfate transporter 1
MGGDAAYDPAGRLPKNYQHPDLFRSPEATIDPDFSPLEQVASMGSSSSDREEEAFLGRFVQRLKRRGKQMSNKISFSAAEQYGILLDTDEDRLMDTSKRSHMEVDSWFEWKTIRRRMPYYMPILMWLPKYNWRESLIYDLFAGVAVAAMIIPQSIALSLLAGLEPIYGLYSVWITCLVYACMGNSRQMSYGPETVAAMLIGLTLQDKNPSDPAAFAHILSFMSGVFLFAMGIFRFGFLDSVLSRPLLSGFINAVAVTIVIEQIDTLLGIPNPAAHDWHKLIHVFNNVTDVIWQSAVVGSCVIVLLFAFKFVNRAINKSGNTRWYLAWFKFVPGVLVAVIASTLVTFLVRLDKQGVSILGEISSSFPTPYPPELTSTSVVTDAAQPGIVIGVLGFIESIIVAKYYASKHAYGISPNRELVAMGMANIIGSFFRTFPTFGSMTRSAVADMAGARSQLYNIFVSLIVLGTILFLGPLFYYLPKPALAGIIIVAAFNIFEFEDIHFLWSIRAYKALLLLAVTFVTTIALGIELGLLIGLGVSVFLIIQHTAFPHIALLGRIPGTSKYRDIALFKEATTIPGVIIMRVDEGLYFANVGQIKEMLSRIERLGSHLSHPTDRAKSGLAPLAAVVFDARNIFEMDPSAVMILQEMVHEYKQRNVKVCFVKLRSGLKQSFIVAGVIDPLGGHTVFGSLSTAVEYATQGLRNDAAYSSYINEPDPSGAGSERKIYKSRHEVNWADDLEQGDKRKRTSSAKSEEYKRGEDKRPLSEDGEEEGEGEEDSEDSQEGEEDESTNGSSGSNSDSARHDKGKETKGEDDDSA